MAKKVLSLVRHICLIWLIIYLIISIFKFIQINNKINEKYVIVSKKFSVVGYTNESIVIDNILLFLDRTIFPHFNPFYRYTVPKKMSTSIVLKASFMDKTFSVTMKDGQIIKDNFYEVLMRDEKFQHLYSEWVKKQVGIEDEGVELKFSRAKFWSRVIGDDVYIDFNKITTNENLEKQICENTHNIYVRSNYHESGIVININDSSKDIKSLLEYADDIEKKIHHLIFIYEDNSTYVNKKNNILYISFDNKNSENNIDVMYNYDDNTKHYKHYNKDNSWIEYE